MARKNGMKEYEGKLTAWIQYILHEFYFYVNYIT